MKGAFILGMAILVLAFTAPLSARFYGSVSFTYSSYPSDYYYGYYYPSYSFQN